MKYKRFGDLQPGDRFNTASGGKIPVSVRILQKISPTFAIDITSGIDDKYTKKYIALSMPVVIRNEVPMIKDFDHENLIHEYNS